MRLFGFCCLFLSVYFFRSVFVLTDGLNMSLLCVCGSRYRYSLVVTELTERSSFLEVVYFPRRYVFLIVFGHPDDFGR